MAFIVLIKDRRNEKITQKLFRKLSDAEQWVEFQMNIWEEDRAYKIVVDREEI